MSHALIIDDKQMNIDVLTMLLGHENVSFTSLTSPRHLDEVIEETEIDVIFLDLELPNNDGFDILQDMKADSRFTDIPIIAYTVHTSEIDRARRAGFDGFLGKPLNTQRFAQQLERILKGEKIWEI